MRARRRDRAYKVALAGPLVAAIAVIAGAWLPGTLAAAAPGSAPGGTPGPAPGPSTACQHAPTPGSYQVDLSSGGLSRSAVVHVPPAPARVRLPLVLALHGAGQNGTFFEAYTGLSVLADSEGFIAVYPNATVAGRDTFWTINDANPRAANDVQFISDLLDQLQTALCVDPDRVYATGVSNGAGMAARLACELSTRLAAIAPVAGGYKSQPACHPLAPVSVLEVHGTADGTVPYDGVPGTGAGAVGTFLGQWAARDVCQRTPAEHRVAPRVLQMLWGHCTHGTSVAHLEVFGGGHQLPGALPPDRGQVSTISTMWWIWSFLRDHIQAPPYRTAGKKAHR